MQNGPERNAVWIGADSGLYAPVLNSSPNGRALMARGTKKRGYAGGMSDFISNFVRRAPQDAAMLVETRRGASREW